MVFRFYCDGLMMNNKSAFNIILCCVLLCFSVSCGRSEKSYSIIAYNNSDFDFFFKITDSAGNSLNRGYLKQSGTAGVHNISNDITKGIGVS